MIDVRSWFTHLCLGSEQSCFPSCLISIWVLMGRSISALKLLPWIGYSDFHLVAGRSRTMKRCFNTCKALGTFTCQILYLESELVGWDRGVTRSPISVHYKGSIKSAYSRMKKGLDDWNRENKGPCIHLHLSNNFSACSTCYSVVKLPNRLSVLPKMVSFLEVSVFIIWLIGELGWVKHHQRWFLLLQIEKASVHSTNDPLAAIV